MDYSILSNTPRFLLEADLKPVSGQRFQTIVIVNRAWGEAALLRIMLGGMYSIAGGDKNSAIIIGNIKQADSPFGLWITSADQNGVEVMIPWGYVTAIMRGSAEMMNNLRGIIGFKA